jgi:hypothetical protein
MLEYKEITDQLFQLGSDIAFKAVSTHKPRSVIELAMVLAMIRPGKNYLIGKTWDEVKESIWRPEQEYYWKKAHAISYAIALVVHMNLLSESLNEGTGS